MASGAIHIISKLLNPIPQYVLGCLPAIAIIGTSPKGKFAEKLTWVLRCFGCPFTGLLYSYNVGKDEVKLCIYWLSSEYFQIEVENVENKQEGQLQLKQLDHRPVGVYAMSVKEDQDKSYKDIIKRCTARASVLERLSSLVSIYYIVVGVIAAISRTTGQFSCEDWPYISLLLSWTIPAVFKRAFSGTLVVKDPNVEFAASQEQEKIIMEPVSGSYKKQKFFTVSLVAFVSMVYPWITVFLAFYTPPVGYYCRSKLLSIFCSVWSFNSFLAYISHWVKEDDVEGHSWIHIWFSFCGFILAIFLFILALFTNNIEWWGMFNDPNCSTTCGI
ncbi:unnamed protein product [Rhizophagus irregularis]|uniref:Uncharacterized protein n=1 Tax=Rhizophagus irregularis TaxID=588596 RepID=A0A2I1G0T7_9GLOM|nr:hypothetical protein RhiirA4_415688 [Rhizophagus irregularis]CAB4406898.1 unnamed protein product [Rhizophagus irregularis]CAB4407497.1 unnamed protein product [Rhizophagus irregularis]